MKLFPLSFHLSAFEFTFVKTSNPALRRQKEFLYSLKVLHNIDAFRLILFSPNTARFFSTVASFPALSILTILLDKCQMKSFQNIDVKVNFFVWNTFFFGKNFFFEKKCLVKFYLLLTLCIIVQAQEVSSLNRHRINVRHIKIHTKSVPQPANFRINFCTAH